MSGRSIPPLAKVVFGAVLISFSPILVLAVRMEPTLSAFYRVVFSALVLFLWPSQARGSVKDFPPGLLRLIAVAGVAFALDLFCWHRSVLYTGAGLATILGNTQVLYVSLLGIFVYKEKASARFLTAVPLAFCGVVMLVRFQPAAAGRERFLVGVVYGLATGGCYAVFLYAMRKIQVTAAGLSTHKRLSLVLGISALVLAPISLLEGNFSLPAGTEWMWLFLLGAGPGALAWIVISENLPRIPISRTGLALLLQPVLASCWGVAFYREAWGLLQALGGAITLAAIYLGTSAGVPLRREIAVKRRP